MASSSAQQHRWTYDVFVSFRGKDIRKSFMDHLFKDFEEKGIRAFKDDRDLTLGENISPNLEKVIQESRFLVVIFSENYASSSWCLSELVKILECNETSEHKHEVRIIFYDVKPDVVRKQTGSYAKAFAEHEISNRTEVAKWKEALSTAANLSGWDLQDMANGFESKFIASISEKILKALSHVHLHVGENLVGMYARVNEMNLVRFVGSDKVHMIGICGISGIGKTTLAKAIYNSMFIHFEEYSFCEDVQGVVKQHGLTQVQMQLIGKIMKTRVVEISSVSEGIMVIKQSMPTKPVLLVLDDVDHRDQLEALAGSRDWFFPGSLIIFTGKDKQLLWSHKVDEIYDMPVLPEYRALELFSLYAFGEKHPRSNFEELSYQVVRCLQGHPLALRVLGSCLYGKLEDVWQSEVKRLQKYPNAEIQEKLQPSFNGLNDDQRRIFLDIACSFIGEKRNFVASVLDNTYSFVLTDMEVLVNKSLITISGNDNSLQMHDLVRSMARSIIHKKVVVKNVPSIMWNLSEVSIVKKNKLIEEVEVLDLFLNRSSQNIHIHGEAFESMRNLRVLKVYDAELGNSLLNVKYHGKLKFLSNKLTLLYWHGFPFEFPSKFSPENLVAIDLSYSHLDTLWRTPKCFRKLKVMKLRHCRNLTSTPDFTSITNLEELILEGCVNLVEVHPSFGMLKKLVILNMKDCKSFRNFSCKLEMDSLEVMIFTGCSGGDKFPESRSCTSTSQHPQSLGMPSLVGLCSLQKLNFSHCNLGDVSDSSIGGLSCLEYLNLDGNNFTSLPRCLSQLSRLRHLGLSSCKKLEVLPELPLKLEYLDANDCTSLHKLEGPLSYEIHSSFAMHFESCPNLFRNFNIESQVSMLNPQSLTSSITSHSYRNHFSSLFSYMNFPSNTSGIFNAQEERVGGNHLDIIYHGNGIPQWFTNRSNGNHVKVELPRDWCISKFRGHAICVVSTLKKSYCSKACYNTPKYRVDNSDGTFLVGSYPFYSNSIRTPESDIIWFRFMPRYYDKGLVEANNFVTFSFEVNDEVEVKECGVRLVFDEDIQREETSLSITEDLPDPTQNGGGINVRRGSQNFYQTW